VTNPAHVAQPRSEELSVYVHFPWCLQKCPYCDFLSVPAGRPEIPQERYTEAVLRELDRRSLELPEQATLTSVFFGGGTPSLWEPRELGRVLAAILRRLRTPPGGVEITVECNPSSLDEERARALVDVGVNRLSIGVQSLDQKRLEFLGRLHDAAGGLAAVAAAVRAGVPRVSADLIFGVAGQSPLEARHEVRTVAELGVTHLSAYALTIEQGTRFGELARRGRLPLLDDALVADSFSGVEAELAELGFEHYEISNYAKPGAEARHNLGYWRGRDYLGLGTGAFGTWQTPRRRERYRNTPAHERYMKGWLSGEPVDLGTTGELVSELEPISPEVALRERLLLGLRLAEGVELEELERDTGAVAQTPERLRVVERLLARGKLARDGERLYIPRDRWLFADAIIAEIM
jgi:oxygen-independent coproporphyrinogen-3 oxidase